MAYFHMRKDAEVWFRDLFVDQHNKKKPFEVKYDLYYLCLMLGLAHRQTSDPTASGRKTTGFIDHLPQTYKPTQRLVLGLLLRAELESEGVGIDEKEEVRKIINDLIDPAQGYSDQAVSRLNAYSSGGFDILVQALPDRPRTTPEFFRIYLEMIEEAPV